MKLLASLAFMISMAPGCALGQKYLLQKSLIIFFSDGIVEDITAQNKKASSIFNSATGEIAFSVPISEFQFEKSLMQEHFNEKYMESDKYPRAMFQGRLEGFEPSSPSDQKVRAVGKLTIHGVTRDVDINGTVQKNGTALAMKSKFIVKLADYNITIPQLLFQNIAEQVEVSVDFVYKPG